METIRITKTKVDEWGQRVTDRVWLSMNKKPLGRRDFFITAFLAPGMLMCALLVALVGVVIGMGNGLPVWLGLPASLYFCVCIVLAVRSWYQEKVVDSAYKRYLEEWEGKRAKLTK